MVDKPRLAIDIYNQYVRENRLILWPDDLKERALLARALFGRELISKLDSWIKYANDLIENPEPQTPFPRHNKAYFRDKYFRDNLQSLNADQKQAVRNLTRTVIHGTLFSALVTLDQGHFGKYNLLLMPSQDRETPDISLFRDLDEELHDELNDWIVSFSKFSDEILELVQHPKGWWHFQPKEFY